jgi:hypothetical protein
MIKKREIIRMKMKIKWDWIIKDKSGKNQENARKTTIEKIRTIFDIKIK